MLFFFFLGGGGNIYNVMLYVDTATFRKLTSFILCLIYSQEKKSEKRRLFKKVQAFCEEKVLRCLLGVFWYTESKNQCWQAEKWHLHYLICIFPRWPPN